MRELLPADIVSETRRRLIATIGIHENNPETGKTKLSPPIRKSSRRFCVRKVGNKLSKPRH